MILYIYPAACSLVDHIALIAAGLPYTIAAISHDKMLPDGSNYLAINPSGYVPALVLEDGTVLTENLAILVYIADRSGALHGGNGFTRWRALEALSFMATTVHGNLSPYFKKAPEPEKEKAAAALAEAFASLADQLGDKHFLLGDTMSIADPYLFWTLLAANNLQIPMPARLAHYFVRMKREQSVMQALAEEGLS